MLKNQNWILPTYDSFSLIVSHSISQFLPNLQEKISMEILLWKIGSSVDKNLGLSAKTYFFKDKNSGSLGDNSMPMVNKQCWKVWSLTLTYHSSYIYRWKTALFLRVHCDKIRHVCWDFDASSAQTRKVSALDKHQNWRKRALFCHNSRA